ncbi:MAG: ATP:cob(I)alamin adenosyltransferase [Candidatus Nomurabacteria bacterium GW2011_GWE1_32_28]|uniref:Corrinoid adenosyltransferase n=1 Tax=Candidatus Nomurabacteria bacterium GW2011_GWF1_31_48 TaxID=1618767 RepID=A0A0G0BGZ9_9BACT|nr:MAG: ATP:cob(I)alamin adenosyltransferase [Candidatus Nomurabacteria bacterium GW2011_GWF2_30_133]KKP28745.1 MAG: ATP:cob(I)alamin adenosyltransferase [Candidatus Nomurabacteria bacterium GW2011_GWE2_31_40]KKP30322.1 MAG: ATP:cob(I)alamin adenosyltransferase [Candidatus Nomurabacteria bacterium GW2011_GWF1_31_48]KKP34849.1 MAG: ATP:cob(I)alamin adenosyltransferase [Candidatus Nomurabacteria bacterium GW2011_GWE1_32_28]HAS80693.1 cob(I)yrinic acid a,c-diamide adenosyltransferase [Candidatus N
MLYTRKGDNGTTKTFGCDQRISKSSKITEALGALDEINSFLGLCKVKAKEKKFFILKNIYVDELIHNIQKNLFIVQAELAGASMYIDEEKLKEIEIIIDSIEKELPPIKTFFISGGTELASVLDIARTISRRAERRVVSVVEEEKVSINKFTLAYLNRLSSLLYAFARSANYKSGIAEESPNYK